MRILIFSSCALLLVIGVAYVFMHKEAENPMPELAGEVSGTPVFAWSYRAFEREGIPYSEIILTATYENGAYTSKSIESIEGGCNTYEPADSDVYDQSTMLICYYAGLGRYYKVVAEGDGYAVKRKIFEEAAPEYDPPARAYETITRF